MPVRVTVIIATYNWSTVLPFSIGSVLDQTFRDFELLVIGDGCTDDSAAVVAGIADPRIRWINLPVNSGHQSGPNSEGLLQAAGEFIAYLGHDDLWFPHHLAAVTAALDGGADVATTIVARVAADGSTSPLFFPPRDASHVHGWMPPTGIAHRKAVTDRVGAWRNYREIDVDPESDLLRRARDAGFRFSGVSRLSAVKFPAAARRNVYRLRPWHEQSAWLARIRAEKDLEQTMMASWLVDAKWRAQFAYRQLLVSVWRETARRLLGRIRNLRPRRRGAAIDARRSFKGL